MQSLNNCKQTSVIIKQSFYWGTCFSSTSIYTSFQLYVCIALSRANWQERGVKCNKSWLDLNQFVPVCWQVPRLCCVPVPSVGSIRTPSKELSSSINVTIQSVICADAVGRSGHCAALLPLAFHFTLQDAVHIKVVIEAPQSEIPVWQGSEVFKKRMRALTQHGRLNQPADSQEED